MQGIAIEPQSNIEYFVFPDLLEGYTLAYNPSLLTLNCLINARPYPLLQAQQQFTELETTLLLPLLRSFPHYAPYELLLTSFSYGLDGITDERIEKAKRRMHKALERGTWDVEMRPVRNVLSRTRFKLRGLHLDAISLLETGYILHAYRVRHTSNKIDMPLSEKS